MIMYKYNLKLDISRIGYASSKPPLERTDKPKVLEVEPSWISMRHSIIVEGCPKSGVLFPLLWASLVNDLI